MKGYAVDAMDYVLKPVNYYAFTQRIERAISRMSRRREQFIPVPIKGGVQKLALSEIRYVEVQDHDLLYHMKNGNTLFMLRFSSFIDENRFMDYTAVTGQMRR